jgi:uncharacterized protein (DUF433 family)
MAYPAPVAAALSGATLRQLAYWRNERASKGALLAPDYRPSPGRILYSFRDVVALRTFTYLREGFSLQKIRRAIDNLREIGNRQHLSQYRLISVGDSILLAEDEAHATDLLQSPTAGRMVAVLGEVVKPFRNRIGEQVVDLYRPRRHLEVDPETRGGYPVIEQTRIPYDQVSTLVADGVSPSAIAEFYPGVTAAGAKDALSFAIYVNRLREAA